MLSSFRKVALRGGRRCNVSSITPRIAFVQPFSSTPRYDVNALFKKTENEELNEILHEIQDKIILPAYLPEKQRKIVFSTTQKQYLEQNPIEIEVEGFEHRFKHIDPHKDIPKVSEIVDKAFQTMKTREDFDNVGTLLAGVHKATSQMTPRRTGKYFRYMVVAQQTGALIGCLKQFKETGLLCTTKEGLLRLYIALVRDAQQAEGNIEALQQIQRWSDIVQDVIQRPEHEAAIEKYHVSVANLAARRMDSVGVTDEFRNAVQPIFSAHSNKDLRNSVFGRTMALYPRLALVKAKQAAGEDVETDMVKVNDEIETVKSLWYERQHKDAKEFDFSRVLETYQVCPSVNPRGNFATWFKDNLLGHTAYLHCLARTYLALKEAEIMSPTAAEGLTAVANRIPAHAAKLLQITGPEKQGAAYKVSFFKETTGIDLLSILETLPPLENHNKLKTILPQDQVAKAEAELEEGAAAEEEVEVGETPKV